MACNDNICPPNPCTLKNAILNYKRAVGNSTSSAALQAFLTIIDQLQKQINCNNCSGANGGATQTFPCDTPSKVWTFKHNLKSKLLLVQVYDNEYNQLIPENIELVDDNTAVITFSENACGYAVANFSSGGDCGTSGNKGTGGTSGTSGLTGTSGTSASPGTSGTSGGPGTSGTSGKDATSGTSGSNGKDGTSGSSGSSGSSGTSGSSGSSGSNGTSGSSGTSGSNGTSGSSGTSGTSGSSGTSGTSPAYAKTFQECIDMSKLVVGDEFPLLISDMSYTIGQPIIIAYTPSDYYFQDIYFTGTVIYYIPKDAFEGTTSGLLILKITSVVSKINETGDEIYCNWTINLGGGFGSGSTGSAGTSGTSADSFVFDDDLVVSISASKSFGRYVGGDIIPSSGKTVAELIELALKEPLNPTVTLSSSTVVLFNQTSIENLLNAGYIINSYEADIDTALLEWRRNNSGSWMELSISTSNPLEYTHSLTDTNYNSHSFNYKYTVTDTLGASSYKIFNIVPTLYNNPTINLKISASSFSPPETYTKRESGNFKSILTGSVKSNNPYIPLKSYSVQYDINDEEQWISVPGLNNITVTTSPQTIPSTIHNPIGNNFTSSISYRLRLVDGFQTSSYNASIIDFKYMMYYGTSSIVPTVSSHVRRLQNRIFADSISPSILNTEDGKIFVFATPFTASAYYGIYEVLDLDASYSNLIDRYVLYTFNVNDSGSNAIPYNVYVNSNAIAYTDRSHRHQVRHGFLSGSLYYSSSLWTLNWYTGPNYTGKAYLNVTLNNFNLINPALVGSIQINSGSS